MNALWRSTTLSGEKCSHSETMLLISGYHVYVNSEVGLCSERQIAQIPANCLSSVPQHLLPRGHLVLPHPGFETMRTGIPNSLMEGNLLQVAPSPGISLLKSSPRAWARNQVEHPTSSAEPTHQRVFLPKIYHGRISASEEYSNICTFVSLIAIIFTLSLSVDYIIHLFRPIICSVLP